jgi:hypothetical protein
MTQQLQMALYAEGRTDERFLPILIQRTANQILLRQAKVPVEVLDPICLDAEPDVGDRAKRILSVARKAYGYHCLIVHADADAPTSDDALNYRYAPGKCLVEKSKDDVCDNLLPIIPIRMMEAWIMADFNAFRDAVGTDLSSDELGFPNSPHQVEAIRDPKFELGMALNKIFSKRRHRKRTHLGQYYEPVARRIRLEALERVPAFRQFTQDLGNVIRQLYPLEPS